MDERGKRELTKTGEALQMIMEERNMGTNALAEALKKPVSTVCERIYQKNISIEKLDEMVRVMGYKIMLVPIGTRSKGFYDVG